LVKGASQGEGLGNQFLSHIRETSAICHVLRGFTDSDIIREGATSPVEDLATIRTELQLADLATLEKQKPPKGSTNPEEGKRWASVEKLKVAVGAGRNASTAVESEKDAMVAKELGLITAKPELFVINVDEDNIAGEVEKTAGWAKQLEVETNQVVVISAKIESELSSLSAEDQQAYLSDLGLKQSGLDRLIIAAYATLGLQSFLTAGELEARAWTIKKGSTAPVAAGEIHTDFTKKFIRANIASFADFVQCGGWKGVKEAGKLRTEGKDYVMQDGDVVEFLIGS
jgi:GTP-binding protein YchF